MSFSLHFKNYVVCLATVKTACRGVGSSLELGGGAVGMSPRPRTLAIKPFQCTECEKHYSPPSILDQHMNIHRAVYKCRDCGKCCLSSKLAVDRIIVVIVGNCFIFTVN